MKRFMIAGLLVASLCYLAGPAGAQEQTSFSNPTAGFSMPRPAGWQTLTAGQNLDAATKVKPDDPGYAAAMEKLSTAPLMAMLKFAKPYNDLNPSFKVDVKPLGKLKGTAPIEIVALFLPSMEKAFADLKIVQAPKEVEVSGLKAGYARMTYTMHTVAGAEFPATAELWFIPRGDYLFAIGASTRQDESNATRQDMQAILDTVKIEH